MSKGSLRGYCAMLAIVLAAIPAALQAADYDVVIRGGRLLDGSGNPWVYADIAVSEGRIAAVGRVTGSGKKEVDASGRYVSPGWIDMMDQSGSVLLENGDAPNKVLMGVTSAIGGEGGTPVPAGEIATYFARLEEQGISINFGSYYNALQAREAVVGTGDKAVTEDDIAEMKRLMALAMEEGVVGMSTAAFFPPASFMTTHEFIELAKAMAPYGGIYAAHMRDESRKLIEAIEEMITVAEMAQVPAEIFHFKNGYAPNWDKEVHTAIALIEAARARGVEIAADQYPYVAGATGIEATVPSWVFADDFDTAVARLRDPEQRARMKRDIVHPSSDRMVMNSGGWERIVLANPHNQKYDRYVGKSFAEIGKLLRKDPADAAWDIMLEGLPNRAYALYYVMDERDVQTIMKQPWVSIGSDAGAVTALGEVDFRGLTHPRSYGTFPRIIARYVREKGVLTLEDAIRKMTAWPAARMKLKDRGMIKPGHWADIVIFDYNAIQDNATWDEPARTPSGVNMVLVNGVVVAEDGMHTGARPGKVLYGPGRK